MRTVVKSTLVLAVVLGMVSVAQAQRGRGFGFGPGALLQNEGVQKELKITDDQKTKLKEALEKVRDSHKDDFEKIREMSPEDRQKFMRKVGAETQKAIAGILDAKQVKRLKQIEWQVGGARVLAAPEVQKGLKLSDDQKKKIAEVLDDSNKKMRELFQGGGGSREKFQELRKETEEKANNVLTADQKKSWKEMKGQPFEFQRQRRQQ